MCSLSVPLLCLYDLSNLRATTLLSLANYYPATVTLVDSVVPWCCKGPSSCVVFYYSTE